jgi:hypothetical protein
MYLVYYSETACLLAIQQINLGLNLPDGKGSQSWDKPNKAYGQNLWYIKKPDFEILADYEIENILSFREPLNIPT